jgi:hypothetical protein
MANVAPNILPSGTTFAQLQAGGVSGHLERLITANTGGSPTPTVAATLSSNAGGTSGGLLPAGVYYVNFTEADGTGETTVSAESGPVTLAAQAAPTGTPTVAVSGSGGTLPAGVYFGKFTYVETALNAAGLHGETTPGNEFTFTQTTAAEPTITINDGGLPSWASGRNLYLTAAAGGTGNEVLAFSAITGTTYQITVAPAASTTTPPAANSTTTNIPRITAFPTLGSGSMARNIYISPAGGGSGSELLYATGITATTFTFSAAAPSSSFAVRPPTSNTTAFTYADANGNTLNTVLVYLRAYKFARPEAEYKDLCELVEEINRGEPISFAGLTTKLKHHATVYSMLATVLNEISTLYDSNPGTLRPTIPVAGMLPQVRRSWP